MVICLVVSYIIVLTEFNNGQFPPDVLRDDINNSVMLGESNGMMQFHSPPGLKVKNYPRRGRWMCQPRPDGGCPGEAGGDDQISP